jgi:hypothetical protein
MNDALVALATALTNIVFPVPMDQLDSPDFPQFRLANLVAHKAKHHEEDQYQSWYKVPSTSSASTPTAEVVAAHLFHRKLDSLPDLLFLRIQSTNIRVFDIRFLIGSEHCDRRISLWG